MSKSTPRFSSRFAFLVSALGIAIGTGNIWRFPRIAASNGGDDGAGSFLIFYGLNNWMNHRLDNPLDNQ